MLRLVLPWHPWHPWTATTTGTTGTTGPREEAPQAAASHEPGAVHAIVPWRFQTDDDYADRPGLSPTVASLRAAGVIRERDAVLEVGCGTGMDAVGLARSGVRDITGVDKRAAALRLARRRAREAGVRVAFARGSAYDLRAAVRGRRFDVVIDTLLGNNLHEQARYAASLARVVRPRGGLLAATWKVEPGAESLREFEPGGEFERAGFRVVRQVPTQLPTRTLSRARTWLEVVTVIAKLAGGRPRTRGPE